jgi:MFS transporter, BCD family, chlorophyll transporter
MTPEGFGWTKIVRLGLVQTALGAIVVLMTSTINRVMVVELAFPALVPGLLVAAHYGVQALRPAWGYGSDIGGRRTPWIIGGMAALAFGAVGAALGTALAGTSKPLGVALAALSFLVVGIGVGAAGTSVLAMLATRVAASRRAAAASTVWMMMIFGFALSAPLAGHFLDPFSNERLIGVTATVSAAAFLVSALAVWGVENDAPASSARRPAPKRKPGFVAALREQWSDQAARRFAIFIFISMLAYSAQELLIEPFAGLVFGMTPGVTTKLAGLQHGGALTGMIGVAVAASAIGGPVFGSLRLWTIGGCLASALSLLAIAAGGLLSATPSAFVAAVFALGVSNGAFAVAAIGSMMSLAGAGPAPREGTRMGIWGAAQAIAFGLGGVAATLLVDVARLLSASPPIAYSLAFAADATLFLFSAALAGAIARGFSPAHANRALTRSGALSA